jgi:hypothetical protein
MDLRNLLLEHQKELGLDFRRNGKYSCYIYTDSMNKTRPLQGLNKALEEHLYKGKPKFIHSSIRTAHKIGGSLSPLLAKKRGIYLDHCRDRYYKSVIDKIKRNEEMKMNEYYKLIVKNTKKFFAKHTNFLEVIKNYYEKLIYEMQWIPLTSQLIARWGGMGTACDEMFYSIRDKAIICVECKSGFLDTNVLDAPLPGKLATINRGPFKDSPVQGSWRKLHEIQALVTKHMIDRCYGTPDIRVSGCYVYYLDRKELTSVSIPSAILTEICTLCSTI